MEIPYFKMENAGNSFIIIESKDLSSPDDKKCAAVQQILSQSFGLGADQLLEKLPAPELGFNIWNADGSTAEMCGNGALAFAQLAEKENWAAATTEEAPMNLVIAGKPCQATRIQDRLAVHLGEVKLLESKTVEAGGETVPYWLTSVGNTHAIVFLGSGKNEWNKEEFTLYPWGHLLSQALQTNVHFVNPETMETNVWELGSGPTLACGSGALCIATQIRETYKPEGKVISLRMSGGTLNVLFQNDKTWLSGTPRLIARGTFYSA